MSVGFVLLYMVAGVLLSLPYTALAGWSAQAWSVVMMTSPAFAVMWFIMAIEAGIVEPNHRNGFGFTIRWRALLSKGYACRRPMTGMRTATSVVTVYIMLPILAHLGSLGASAAGFETVSNLLYEHRYLSMFYALKIAIAVCVIIVILSAIYKGVAHSLKWAKVRLNI